MKTPVPCHVEVQQVREVSLLGRADLDFWSDHLQAEDLHPTPIDGKAQLLIISAAARWMGVRFEELSISVFVSRHKNGATPEGVYMTQAFNSSRFFSFVERTFFHAPYGHGEVRIKVGPPCSIELSTQQGANLVLEMSPDIPPSAREPGHSGPDGWQGPIFLPQKKRTAAAKVYFGKIAGHTQSYPFCPQDRVTLQPAPGAPILEWLQESHFAGHEWIIRENATHARSRTLGRSRL